MASVPISLYVIAAESGDLMTQTPPPQIVAEGLEPTIEVDGVEYLRVNSIPAILNCMNFGLSGGVTRKQARDCMKDLAAEIGWDNLSATDQATAARFNIGTGAQILAAVPILKDRIYNSYEYLVLVGGIPNGAAQQKSWGVQAIVFAACKHIVLPSGIALPEAILTFLNCDPAKRGVTIAGVSWLDLYETKRLQGYYKGDGTTGLYDWFASTADSEYAGAGMKEVFAGIPDAAWQMAGFDNVTAFSNYCLKYLDTGIW